MPFTLAPAALPWKKIAAVVAALLALWAIYVAISTAITNYGEARYEAGVADTDKAWREAADVLREKSREAGVEATASARAREDAYAQDLEETKKEIEDAVREGRDPMDSLFPARRVQPADNP